jgi:hypothetical protein
MTDQDRDPEEQESGPNGANKGRITIYVNRHPFRVADQPVTGAALKELPTPPIRPDLDLVRIMHGGDSDLFVRPDEVVELENGTEFFAVPRTIMAGRQIVVSARRWPRRKSADIPIRPAHESRLQQRESRSHQANPEMSLPS